MPSRRIIIGPMPHDICEMQMLRPRLCISELSEMYVHEAGTPMPTDMPVSRKPRASMAKLTEHMTSSTPAM